MNLDENTVIIAGEPLKHGEVVTCKAGEVSNEYVAYVANAVKNQRVHGFASRQYPTGAGVRLIVSYDGSGKFTYAGKEA